MIDKKTKLKEFVYDCDITPVSLSDEHHEKCPHNSIYEIPKINKDMKGCADERVRFPEPFKR